MNEPAQDPERVELVGGPRDGDFEMVPLGTAEIWATANHLVNKDGYPPTFFYERGEDGRFHYLLPNGGQ